MASAYSAQEDADLGSRTSFVLLSLLVVGAAILRVPTIGEQSFWLDEAVSWHQSRGSLEELFRSTAGDNYPPLHNLFLFFVIHTIGDAEWMLRLPSAIFGIANILAIYWVGALLHSRRVGLLAALILALSPFHIWYSQEARTYTLLALAATMFFALSAKFVQRPNTWRALGVIICGATLLYSHPYGAFTWAAIAGPLCLYVWFGPAGSFRKAIVFASVQVAVALTFLPWIPILATRTQVIVENGFWIAAPTLEGVLAQANALASGQIGIFVVGLGLAAAALLPGRQRAQEQEAGSLGWRPWVVLVVLTVWALSPLAAGIAISLVLKPLLVERYLIGSLPAIALVSAIGLGLGARSLFQFLAVALALVGIFAISAGLSKLPIRDDWRSVGEHLSAEVGQKDCVVVSAWWHGAPLEYYYRNPPACLVTPGGPDDLAAIPESASRVALVLKDDSFARDALLSHVGRWQIDSEVQFPSIKVLMLKAVAMPTVVGGMVTVKVVLSGDAYQGPPTFSLTLDGKQIGSGTVESALATETSGGYRSTEELMAIAQTFEFVVPADQFNPEGIIETNFTNDLWGGEGTQLDRNLYVHDIAVNGVSVLPVNFRVRDKETGEQNFLAPEPIARLYLGKLSAIALPPPDGWPKE